MRLARRLASRAVALAVAFPLSLGALGVLALTGCSGGPSSASGDVTSSDASADGAPGDGWDGRTNVEAIFEASCSGCHGQQWSTCWDVQACASTVDEMVSSGAMPRGGTLSASDRSTMLTWLGEGAPCSGPKPTTITGACVGGGGAGTPIAAQ